MTYKGAERQPLDLGGLPAIIEGFRAEGVEAVAICLLHAYANTAHEEEVLAQVRALWPGVSAVASHQITREWREYERTNTAVLSAYVQPVAARYLGRLDAVLREKGAKNSPYIMQSNCGWTACRRPLKPITMVESGPASGWGAAELGKLIDEPNILALDIGGTTAKCSLIEGGEVRIMTDYWIERSRKSAGYPIMVPVVDLVEIATAVVPSPGSMRSASCVGPQWLTPPGPAAMARAATSRPRPTPICGWGGSTATTSGGEIDADMTAETALRRWATSLASAPPRPHRALSASPTATWSTRSNW